MDQEQLVKRIEQAWPASCTVATTAQLSEAGVGGRLLAAALSRGIVVRLRQGAYVLTRYWLACKPWDRDKLAILAHIVTVPSDPTYGYFTAARLHGLFIWNCDAKVHMIVTAVPSATSGARDVVEHREHVVDAESERIVLKNGLHVRVTTMERTVVDCARIGGFEQAVIMGDHALSRGARMDVMQALVDANPGRRGIRKARRVLKALDGRSESPGESRTRLIIASMNIEQPVPQLELTVGDSRYRPDFVWEKQKLIVEFDGDIKYFGHNRTDQVILAERKRERRLMELGWRFVRLEWSDLAKPEEVKRRILAQYARPITAAA